MSTNRDVGGSTCLRAWRCDVKGGPVELVTDHLRAWRGFQLGRSWVESKLSGSMTFLNLT